MKKQFYYRIFGLIVFFSAIFLIIFLYKEKSLNKEKNILYEDNPQEIVDVLYNEITKYYISQTEEYNKLIYMFEERKDMLNSTIHGITQLGYIHQANIFFLGPDWKMELVYLPEDEALSSYEDWFFVYSFDDDGHSYIDFEFYEKIKTDAGLHKRLNQLGQEGVVGYIELSKSYAEVQFIGPFFREHEPAIFKYRYEENEHQQLTVDWYDQEFELMKGIKINDNWTIDMSKFRSCRRQ